MANTIKIKRSSTASDTPSASDLEVGEIAVNTADAKLFTKHTDGTVKELASGGGGGSGSVALDDITTGDAASTLATTTGNITIDAQGSNTDIIFKGTDNTSDITFLTMDGSNSTLLLGDGVKIQSQQSGGSKRASLEFADVSSTSSMIIPNDSGTILFQENISKDAVLESTTSSTSVGPIFKIFRNKTSPANQDVLGAVSFQGKNNNSETINYAFVQSRIRDVADGSENGALETFVETDGSLDLYTVHQDGESQFYKDVQIISSDSGSTENPTLQLYRNSSSPADSDVLGHISFSGENSADEKIKYAEIEAKIQDVTDGTEDGKLDIRVMSNAADSLRVSFQGNGKTRFVNKDVEIGAGINLLFEGSADDTNETTLTVVNPTIDRTITLPDATGTVLTTGNSNTPTTTTSSNDADFVLIDDGGTMKKITPSNLGIGSGGGSGLSNIVEDTSPQLGADLDTNGFNINMDDVKGVTFGDTSTVYYGFVNFNSTSNPYGTTNGTFAVASLFSPLHLRSVFEKVVMGDPNTTQNLIETGNASSNTPLIVRTNTGSATDNLFTIDYQGTATFEKGVVNIKNDGSQSELRLYCESSNAHYAALKAPAHGDFDGNVTLTLPHTTSTLLSSTSNLNDLANVSVSSPSNGQVLKYVSAESRWEAADDATGGSGGNADTVDNKHISVVSSLPGSPDSNTIYFITG